MKWNHRVIPDVRKKAPKAAVKGHGLWFTIWKGWCVEDDISGLQQRKEI